MLNRVVIDEFRVPEPIELTKEEVREIEKELKEKDKWPYIEEFRFDFFDGKHDLHVIIENGKGTSVLRCIHNNESYSASVYDSYFEIYRYLKEMNIESWNTKTYRANWQFFPTVYWKLNIKIDELAVVCDGYNSFPKDWFKLLKLLNMIGVLHPEYLD